MTELTRDWTAWLCWLASFVLTVRLRPRLQRFIYSITGDEGFIEVP